MSIFTFFIVCWGEIVYCVDKNLFLGNRKIIKYLKIFPLFLFLFFLLCRGSLLERLVIIFPCQTSLLNQFYNCFSRDSHILLFHNGIILLLFQSRYCYYGLTRWFVKEQDCSEPTFLSLLPMVATNTSCLPVLQLIYCCASLVFGHQITADELVVSSAESIVVFRLVQGGTTLCNSSAYDVQRATVFGPSIGRVRSKCKTSEHRGRGFIIFPWKEWSDFFT